MEYHAQECSYRDKLLQSTFSTFFCITMVFQYPQAIDHTITNIQDECRIHLSLTISFKSLLRTLFFSNSCDHHIMAHVMIRTDFRPSVHPSISVHIFIFLMVRRLNSSMKLTVCLRPCIFPRWTGVDGGQRQTRTRRRTIRNVDGDGRSTYEKFPWSVVRIQDGPWVNGPLSKNRPLVHLKILMLVQRPNLSMRWTICARILVRCPHGRMDEWTVRRRSSSSVEAQRGQSRAR